MRVRTTRLSVALASLLSGAALADNLSFDLLGRYTTGLAVVGETTSGESAALRGKRLYVTNASDVSLDIVDVSKPSAPSLIKRVPLSTYGSSVTSVDVSSKNLVAVAVVGFQKTDPGNVVFLSADGDVLRTATVIDRPRAVLVTYLPWPRQDLRHLLVPHRHTGADGHDRCEVRAVQRSRRCIVSHQSLPSFAALVQEFLGPYMLQQRALSPRTVASYRDTFVLLLRYAEESMALPAHSFKLTDLSARFLAAFLDHLEVQRNNSVRSRNVRLAAMRWFLKFAARRDPTNLTCGTGSRTR